MPRQRYFARQFLAATGAAGLAETAGCVATTQPNVSNVDVPKRGQAAVADLLTTGRPEVVNLWERDNEVTLKVVKAAHHVHPGEAMNGPITLPVVWGRRESGARSARSRDIATGSFEPTAAVPLLAALPRFVTLKYDLAKRALVEL